MYDRILGMSKVIKFERWLPPPGADEEKLLTPLYRRAETLSSPAREFVDGLEQGDSVNAWIERFG